MALGCLAVDEHGSGAKHLCPAQSGLGISSSSVTPRIYPARKVDDNDWVRVRKVVLPQVLKCARVLMRVVLINVAAGAGAFCATASEPVLDVGARTIVWAVDE